MSFNVTSVVKPYLRNRVSFIFIVFAFEFKKAIIVSAIYAMHL